MLSGRLPARGISAACSARLDRARIRDEARATERLSAIRRLLHGGIAGIVQRTLAATSDNGQLLLGLKLA